MTGDDRSSILIVTAIPEELRPLLGRLSGRRRVGRRPDCFSGELEGARVIVACTGDGRARAETAMGEILARQRPSAWVGAGLAGAAGPGLPAGSLLVATNVGDPVWAARVLGHGGALAARLITLDRIAATSAEKARLAGGDSPASAAVALDTETAGWISAAASLPQPPPGLVVRIVSDAFDEEIPAFVAAASSALGVDRRAVLRRAFTHPAAVGKLLAMRRRARSCAERLAEFLAALARRGFDRP